MMTKENSLTNQKNLEDIIESVEQDVEVDRTPENEEWSQSLSSNHDQNTVPIRTGNNSIAPSKIYPKLSF